jgi:hypothetical protein
MAHNYVLRAVLVLQAVERMQIAGEIVQNNTAGAKAHGLFWCVCGTTEVVPCYKAGLPSRFSVSCLTRRLAIFPAQISALPKQVFQANQTKRGHYV